MSPKRKNWKKNHNTPKHLCMEESFFVSFQTIKLYDILLSEHDLDEKAFFLKAEALFKMKNQNVLL